MKKTGRDKLLFIVNRILILLAVAAILGGLLLDQWGDVLTKAVLL